MTLPPQIPGTFAFVVLSALRAKQLARGCVPKVAVRPTKARTAQAEVAAGLIDVLEPPASAGLDPLR